MPPSSSKMIEFAQQRSGLDVKSHSPHSPPLTSSRSHVPTHSTSRKSALEAMKLPLPASRYGRHQSSTTQSTRTAEALRVVSDNSKLPQSPQLGNDDVNSVVKPGLSDGAGRWGSRSVVIPQVDRPTLREAWEAESTVGSLFSDEDTIAGHSGQQEGQEDTMRRVVEPAIQITSPSEPTRISSREAIASRDLFGEEQYSRRKQIRVTRSPGVRSTTPLGPPRGYQDRSEDAQVVEPFRSHKYVVRGREQPIEASAGLKSLHRDYKYPTTPPDQPDSLNGDYEMDHDTPVAKAYHRQEHQQSNEHRRPEPESEIYEDIGNTPSSTRPHSVQQKRSAAPESSPSPAREAVAADDGAHTFPAPILVPNKRSSATELDYGEATLAGMSYSELLAEPFDHNPAKRASKTDDGPQGDRLDDKIAYYQSKDQQAQSQFFSELSVQDWEACGDWFLEKFGQVLQKTKDARQAKRKAVKEFEDEISKHEEVIRNQKNAIDRKLSNFKAECGSMIQRNDNA